MLHSIQYLRGIAALLVVMFHYRSDLNVIGQENIGDVLFANGYLGVDLFFLISGFVIVLSTQKDFSWKSFIIKRFFRIYPLYLLSILGLVIINQSYTFEEIIKSLLLINFNYQDGAPFFGYSLIMVAWTLSYEIFFYFIFVIAMIISGRYRTIICSVGIITINIGINIYFGAKLTLDGHHAIDIDKNITGYSIFRFLSSPMFYEFVIGMWLSEFYTRFDKSNKFKNILPYKLFLYISVSGALFFFISGINGGHGLTRAGIFCFILLLGAIIYEKYEAIKLYPILFFLGNISYSLYLLHTIVPNELRHIGFVGIELFFLKLVVSLIVSYLAYKLIEKPIYQFSRKLIKK